MVIICNIKVILQEKKTPLKWDIQSLPRLNTKKNNKSPPVWSQISYPIPNNNHGFYGFYWERDLDISEQQLQPSQWGPKSWPPSRARSAAQLCCGCPEMPLPSDWENQKTRKVLGCLKDRQARPTCVAISFGTIHQKKSTWCEVLISWPIFKIPCKPGDV